MVGRDHVESATGFDWNHWPESMEYADKSGNLVFEGVGDVRSDSDELIFFESESNPNGSIDVTTVVDPAKGAKVRGIFQPISFNITANREIHCLPQPLSLLDRKATATPKASDEEILKAVDKYLIECGKPVKQFHLIEYVGDKVGVAKNRVRRLLVQNSDHKGSASCRKRFVYTVGEKNAHSYELPSLTEGQ